MDAVQQPDSHVLSCTKYLPDIVVPAAYLIGGPSRFTNIYAPVPETIVLSREVIAGQTACATVRQELTRSLQDYRGAGRRAKLRSIVERTLTGQVLRMGERVVYDARWVYNGNLAHLFGHHLGNLGFVKSALGLDGQSILVILERDSPKISHDFFHLVGYETYETNGAVEANVLSIAVDHTANYHLVPFIHLLEPPGIAADSGPTRLFISRRTSRRITNEPDVLAVCKEHGHEAVYFEDIPLKTQWALVKHASSIVSIHGAALGFLNTRSVSAGCQQFDLLEIFSPGLVADCYRKIASMTGGHWIGCRGKVTSKFHHCVEESQDYKAMDAADFHLDTGALRLAFEKLPSRA